MDFQWIYKLSRDNYNDQVTKLYFSDLVCSVQDGDSKGVVDKSVMVIANTSTVCPWEAINKDCNEAKVKNEEEEIMLEINPWNLLLFVFLPHPSPFYWCKTSQRDWGQSQWGIIVLSHGNFLASKRDTFCCHAKLWWITLLHEIYKSSWAVLQKTHEHTSMYFSTLGAYDDDGLNFSKQQEVLWFMHVKILWKKWNTHFDGK